MDVPDIMPIYNKLMREIVYHTQHAFIRIERIEERPPSLKRVTGARKCMSRTLKVRKA